MLTLLIPNVCMDLSMKLPILIFSSLIAFSTQNAIASDWQKLAKISHDEFSIDHESLRLLTDAPTTIEVIIAHNVVKPTGKRKTGDKIFSVVSYNCDDKSYQLGISQHYNSASKLVSEIDEDLRDYTFHDVNEDPAHKVLSGLICKNADELRKTFTPIVDSGIYND